MYETLTTQEFDKDFSKLDKSIKIRIDKVIEKLRENPYTGKPLGYEFFREQKVGKHRIYYLIYEQFLVVFVVAMSEKNDQQETIDKVKNLMPFYKEEISKNFKS